MTTRARAIGRLVSLAVLLIAVMWLRRPDQFRHPYIWVEDGTRNLPDYLAHGWWFVAQPIVGYFSVPMRALFATAVTLSLRWLPEISFALTLLCSYLVLVAVAFSPTTLRYRFLCAAAMLLVPISSEVYGVSLYVLWWASLLAFLPLLWPMPGGTGSTLTSVRGLTLRAMFLAVGGLSSPITLGLLPLYAGRWHLSRDRADRWLTSLCAALAAVQATALWANAASLDGMRTGGSIVTVMAKFFGEYVFWTSVVPDSPLYVALGVALLSVIAAAGIVRRHTLDWTFAVLAAAVAVTIALSILRAPADVMHPLLAGGRYFFMPFVLLSWLLLYLLDARHQATTVFCAAALLLATRTTVLYGRWTHPSMDWRGHVEQCLASTTTHLFPVQYEGDAPHQIIWAVHLTGDACRRLVSESVFDNQLPSLVASNSH